MVSKIRILISEDSLPKQRAKKGWNFFVGRQQYSSRYGLDLATFTSRVVDKEDCVVSTWKVFFRTA